MKEVGVSEAADRFGRLLELVEAGEEVVITRRGKPVARMVRSGVAPEVFRAREAAQKIRAMRKGVTLGDIAIGELIRDGRR